MLYCGVDLHKRISYITVMNQQGQLLKQTKLHNTELIFSVLVFAFLLILLPQEAFGRRTREADALSAIQAVEAISAYERGLSRARGKGFSALKAIQLVISPFLGRWDDRHKKMVADNQGNSISGLYFAKLLQRRVAEALAGWNDEELTKPRLVMASIRSVNHIRELIGADIMTIPPEVLLSPAFAGIDASEKTIDKLYFDRTALQSLVDISARDEWYRKSLQLDGMSISEFGQHPLVQEGNAKFIQPYEELLKLIEETLRH